MRNLLKAVLVLFVFNSYFFAQCKETPADSTSTCITAHSLQFQVTDFFKFSSFNGALISYKYHFNENNALRFGIGLNGKDQSSNQGIIKINLHNYSETNDEKYDENNVVSVELNVQYLKYWKARENLFLYGGIGPRLSFSYNDNKSTRRIGVDWDFSNERMNYNKNRGYSIGVNTSFGLEWFFNDFMSLHSEYSFSFSYINNLQESSTRDLQDEFSDPLEESRRETDGYQFNSSGVKLGLSVYF